MKTEQFQIGTVPAILYGEPSDRAYLFLHGQMGHKEEGEAFARAAVRRGYQVLSLDLPGHGERRERREKLLPWTAAPEIRNVLNWAQDRWRSISLRANSIGAYFAMLTFAAPDRALLVSPILDMERLILDMLGWAGVTEEQLRERGEIETSFSQTLSWEFLCWVREHTPYIWTCPIYILYGGRDNMTSRKTVQEYVCRHRAQLTVMEHGEHWFHTPEQMAALRAWEETYS